MTITPIPLNEHIALEFGRPGNRHFHNRLEDDGFCFFVVFAESSDRSLLESDVGRVDGVVLTVVDRHLYADDGEADERAFFHRFAESLVTGRNPPQPQDGRRSRH